MAFDEDNKRNDSDYSRQKFQNQNDRPDNESDSHFYYTESDLEDNKEHRFDRDRAFERDRDNGRDWERNPNRDRDHDWEREYERERYRGREYANDNDERYKEGGSYGNKFRSNIKSGIRRNGCLISILIVIAILFVAAIKNPSEVEAQQMIKLYIAEKVSTLMDEQAAKGDADIFTMIGSFLGKALSGPLIGLGTQVSVNNYVLFSTFDVTVSFSNPKFSVASGIILFGKVIPLKTDLDLDKLKEKDKEDDDNTSYGKKRSSDALTNRIDDAKRTSNTSDSYSSPNGNYGSRIKIFNNDHYSLHAAPMGRNTYYVSNMFDDNPSTAWAINLDDFYGDCDRRWGPQFDVNARRIDYIKIQNGYCKTKELYYENTRANQITIYRVVDNDDGCIPSSENIIYNGPLRDTMDFQTLRVRPEFDNSRPTYRVGLIFSCQDDGFYIGRKYRDLNISELQFFGTPL